MRRKKKLTFTKWIVSIILIMAIIDLQMTYILAFMGSPETLQETSGKLITEILGVVLVYCVKSFFETREEKNNELKEKMIRAGDVTGFDDAEVLSKDLGKDPDFIFNYLDNNRTDISN